MKRVALLSAVLTSGLCLAAAAADSGAKTILLAKVTAGQATAIATRARAGRIIDMELEREKGGSGLRYSFDIKDRGVVYEVGVDAITGALLENGKEPSP